MKLSVNSSTLAGIIFSSVLLTACGGGGGSDGGDSKSGTDTPAPQKPPVVVDKPDTTTPVEEPTTPEPTPPVTNPTDPETDPETPTDSDAAEEELRAGLAVDNFFSMERISCNIGGYEQDQELAQVSNKHANYLKYLYKNANIANVNPHREDTYADFTDVSGPGNPFFAGAELIDRVRDADYAKNGQLVGENIVKRTEYNPSKGKASPEEVGIEMARSLLSAPYHLRSLVNPNFKNSGSSVLTYTPFGTNKDSSFGYVLVSTSSSNEDKAFDSIKPSGITTYPCAATTGTNTGLYGESPNPVKDTGRNLATDPVGHPVHVKVWQADTIKVSNIKFTDVARNIDIPVQLVDSSNDPYKNTYYEMPENEAFFMPLTDSLQSCERGTRKNCGLYGNSKYKVSFDVLSDNKTLLKKEFTFSTGDVNY
ncbi:CAP domain-containing protein [Psychrobacter sp. UBA3480]|uniref:CAP domain-containing protein n=1 Tax=Psychrobacter sp. UBA3480 TaxID=1947350 RepID=UPI0025EBBD7F|nr:CAP domain-containing protein [Psychrobacter sp. UBA3480]